MHLLGSLANNQICGIDVDSDVDSDDESDDEEGGGTFTAEGINALCEALKDNNTLTSLKYAHQLECSSNLPTNVVSSQ